MRRPVLTRTRLFSLALALLGLALLGLTVATPVGLTGATQSSAGDFEVWLVDQSNSFGKTHGGTIHVYEGDDLNGGDASADTPADVLDLGGATAGLCITQTGANPVRPHMLAFMRPIATPS
jgi:hypothetical protein